jgi:putative spermidine/putrescine transport system ATP-binding protein
MTVADQVEFPLRTRRMGSRDEVRRKARDALALVELEHLAGSFPSQLSGGQQQRVALARALVFEPSVLLLDEPLSNLDAELRKQMRSTLKQLHQRLGATFVYVTHDKAEALALADQILVMHDGHIVERGTPDEVYSHPTSAFSARFVSAANCLVADVKERTGNRAVLSIGGELLEGRLFGAAVEERDLVQATVLLRPEDIQIVAAGSSETSNMLHVTVETAVFMGSHIEVVGVVAGGQRLNIHAPTSSRLNAGDVVPVHLDADTVRVVTS